MDDLYFSIREFRDKLVIKNLEQLHNAKSVVDQNTAILIREFDRWNNFRILPREIQEPSAFKRRNKNYDIRNLKNLLSINSFYIEHSIEFSDFTNLEKTGK